VPFVYILQCADGTLYTGWTTDLTHRIQAHNRGKGAKYTRHRLPVKLVYMEKYPTQTTAMQREYAIKRLTRRQKLALIASQKLSAKWRQQMTKLTKIEGIGATYAEKLQAAGIDSIEALLEQGATSSGRQSIVAQTGISDKLVLDWVNRADLMRVKGIGEEYADLLEAAGVDTVPELAQRNPDNLHAKMVAVNQDKHLVRRVPGKLQVANWVAIAKELPRIITH